LKVDWRGSKLYQEGFLSLLMQYNLDELRSRYSKLDTDELTALWKSGELVPDVEAVLEQELGSRGVDLGAAKAERAAAALKPPVSPEDAAKMEADRKANRNALAGGLIGLLVCGALTGATYLGADFLGGYYYILWGPMIMSVIAAASGLIGLLKSPPVSSADRKS
jgi:hypothetical protein